MCQSTLTKAMVITPTYLWSNVFGHPVSSRNLTRQLVVSCCLGFVLVPPSGLNSVGFHGFLLYVFYRSLPHEHVGSRGFSVSLTSRRLVDDCSPSRHHLRLAFHGDFLLEHSSLLTLLRWGLPEMSLPSIRFQPIIHHRISQLDRYEQSVPRLWCRRACAASSSTRMRCRCPCPCREASRESMNTSTEHGLHIRDPAYLQFDSLQVLHFLVRPLLSSQQLQFRRRALSIQRGYFHLRHRRGILGFQPRNLPNIRTVLSSKRMILTVCWI